MKITKDRFYKTVEDTVSYNVFHRNNAIIPVSHKLKFVFSSEENDFNISIQGISFITWLDVLLRHKLVAKSEHHLEVEPLKPYFGDPLFVENNEFEYIYQTIFAILSQLLPESITLESIEYA